LELSQFSMADRVCGDSFWIVYPRRLNGAFPENLVWPRLGARLRVLIVDTPLDHVDAPLKLVVSKTNFHPAVWFQFCCRPG
jgi:hypothetical protein